MQQVKDLNKLLEFIEDENHYYALFGKVIESCHRAKVIKLELWNSGVIEDNESLTATMRIDRAYSKAIDVHKKWVIKRLQNSTAEHTIETLVCTIYNDIFN